MELKKWAIDEMCFRPQGLHINLKTPNVEEFERLCRGGIIDDVWSYVVKHVYSTQNVQMIKGNLKLYDDIKRTSEDELKAQRLSKMVTELRSQKEQIERDVCHDEQKIIEAEHSLSNVNARRGDLEKRCSLLSSYSKKCLEKASVLDEFHFRIQAKISHYRDLKSKSSGERSSYLLQKSTLTEPTGNDQPSSLGFQSTCKRNVRETCEAIGSFLHIYHDSYIEHENQTREQSNNTKAQLWTSVETILSQHAAADVYSSLASAALDSANSLKELTSRIDVRKDALELKFKYEQSGKFSDASSPKPLLVGVHQLIEEGQAVHFQRFLDAEKAKNEVNHGKKMLQDLQQNMETRQKTLFGNNPESLELAQTLYRTELELVASKATLKFIENEIKELDILKSTKQAQLDTLYGKYRQIQDFEKIVLAKRNLIEDLIKRNSDAKLDQQRSEILKYSRDTLVAHNSHVAALSSGLPESISKEMTSFVSLSLHRLQFADFDSDTRFPISQLSISRLNSGYLSKDNDVVSSILEVLQFPDHMASDGLLPKVIEIKSKVLETKELIKCRKTVLKYLNDMEGNDLAEDAHIEAMKNAVEVHEQWENEQILPKIQERLSEATNALSECILSLETLNSWWEQPAQYLAPWEKVDNMNVRQWKDQLTVISTRLRQLQSKH